VEDFMVALDVAAKREGHKSMERKITAAAAVLRAFRAGPSRRKSLDLSPDRAVVEAWALCSDLRGMMRRTGLHEEDAQATLVLLTGSIADEREELIRGYAVPDMASLPELYEKVKALERETNVFPLGVVFKQYDREKERPEEPELWVEPWLVFANATRALSTVEKRFAGLRHGEDIFFHQEK
jgi:hypothetical protein